MTSSMMKCCCIFLIALCLSNGYDCKETVSDSLRYQIQLDDHYGLRWNFNTSHILFELKVETNGYAVFGISSPGHMFPSDVVIGWIENGKTHFTDRYATTTGVPEIDAHQDWNLLGSSNSGGLFILYTGRPLDTGDAQDVPVKAGTHFIHYAYGSVNASSDQAPTFSLPTGQGSRCLDLLNPSADMIIPVEPQKRFPEY